MRYTIPFTDASLGELPPVQDAKHPVEAQPDQEEYVDDDDNYRLFIPAWMCFR